MHLALNLSWIWVLLHEESGYFVLMLMITVSIFIGYYSFGLHKKASTRMKAIFFNLMTVFIFLVISGWFFGDKSKYLILAEALLSIFYVLFFLIIPGFYLLKLINQKYFDNRTSFILAIPVSVFCYAVFFIFLQFLKAPALIYLLLNCTFIILLIVLSIKRKIFGELFRLDLASNYAVLLLLMSIIISISYVLVNINNPELEINNQYIAGRGFHRLPGDNYIPFLSSRVFSTYSEPWAGTVRGWTMGDRPPLMGVVHSIISEHGSSFYFFQIVGTILNSLFLIPVVFIARRIFRSPGAAYLTPLAVLFNGFIFINISYTWPKLFGAYFILTGISLIISRKLDKKMSVIIGVLFSLGGLCHGGALLSLPVLFSFLGVYLLFTDGFKTTSKNLLLILLAFVLVLSPWTIYKKANPKINTNRLIGNFVPYEKDMSIVESVNELFKRYPLKKQLEIRTSNFRKIIAGNNLKQTTIAVFSGDWAPYHHRAYTGEFYSPIIAIGEVQIIISSIVGLAILFLSIFRRADFLMMINSKYLFTFFGFVAMSYIFNILAQMSATMNHTLPYTELILGIALFSGIAFSFNLTLRLFTMSLVTIRFLYYIFYTSSKHGFFLLDFFNSVLILAVFALLILSVKFIDLSNQSARSG